MTSWFLALAVIDCDTLSPPMNGSVTIRGMGVGSMASYSCNVGFTLSERSTRECNDDGNWTGQAPTCIDNECKCPCQLLQASKMLIVLSLCQLWIADSQVFPLTDNYPSPLLGLDLWLDTRVSSHIEWREIG